MLSPTMSLAKDLIVSCCLKLHISLFVLKRQLVSFLDLQLFFPKASPKGE